MGKGVCQQDICLFHSSNVMHMLHWFAGVMMGCMQIPVVLTVNAPLGSSRSYCAMLSCAMTPTGLSHAVPYFKKFYSGIGNWWQVRLCMEKGKSLYCFGQGDLLGWSRSRSSTICLPVFQLGYTAQLNTSGLPCGWNLLGVWSKICTGMHKVCCYLW